MAVLPVERDDKAFYDPHSPEQRRYRSIYTVVSLMCMLILASMFGSRVKHLSLHNLRAMNTMRCLVASLHICGICFIVAAAILQNGLGLATYIDCYAAIIICLVFYLGSKIFLYLFLVERAHAIRAPYKRRLKDRLWLLSMILVLSGFGSIAVVAFILPIAYISHTDGKCRIGLPLEVSIPLLSYDIVINVGFTALFIYLLYPLLVFHREGTMGGGLFPRQFWRKQEDRIELTTNQRPSTDPNRQRVMRELKKLVWKTVVGGLLVMVPTLANLAVLFYMKGHEQGWLCFTICSLDVTWSVCVIHWLTADPEELDGNSDASFARFVTDHMNPSRAGTENVNKGVVSSYVTRSPFHVGHTSESTDEDVRHPDGVIVKTTTVAQSSIKRSDDSSDNMELIAPDVRKYMA